MLLLGACAVSRRPYYADSYQPLDLGITDSQVRQRVILVGDAGMLDEGGDALLRELRIFVAQHVPERTALVYLGDNLYLPGATLNLTPDATAANILDAQLLAGSGTQGVGFVPGNHEWEDELWQAPIDEGLAKVTREQEYVTAPTRAAHFIPPAGCPGPKNWTPPGGAVKIIALDSEWWLLSPQDRAFASERRGCGSVDEAVILKALDEELACHDPSECLPRIVVAHHPLETHGIHGGNFPWGDHLFCGEGLHPVLGYVPAPVVCSIYVGLRKLGISRQDVSSCRYRHFITSISDSLLRRPPLVFAAGHEHSLQVLRGTVSGIAIGSGSGAKKAYVGHGCGTLFAQSEHGFAVVDLLSDGRAALRVFTLRKSGTGVDLMYAQFIEGGAVKTGLQSQNEGGQAGEFQCRPEAE